MDDDERWRVAELLELILRRLNEPVEVSVSIHVVNEAGPPTSIIVTPGIPQLNQKEETNG